MKKLNIDCSQKSLTSGKFKVGDKVRFLIERYNLYGDCLEEYMLGVVLEYHPVELLKFVPIIGNDQLEYVLLEKNCEKVGELSIEELLTHFDYRLRKYGRLQFGFINKEVSNSESKVGAFIGSESPRGSFRKVVCIG